MLRLLSLLPIDLHLSHPRLPQTQPTNKRKTKGFLRYCYDGLQIPVQKWKSVKYASNTLFILIKSLEWTCLLALYPFEFEPETKIQKQHFQPNLLLTFDVSIERR